MIRAMNFLTLDAVAPKCWTAQEVSLLEEALVARSEGEGAMGRLVDDILQEVRRCCKESALGAHRLALRVLQHGSSDEGKAFALEVLGEALMDWWLLPEEDQGALYELLLSLGKEEQWAGSVEKLTQ
ncbi:unnamed protein product, partial [Effrenium voratum]